MKKQLFYTLFIFSTLTTFAQTNVAIKTIENRNTNNQKKMTVEVWSDVMCPFCYIGKKKLEAALAQFPNKDNIEVIWKSFQLDPDVTSTDAKDYTTFLAQKKGLSTEQVKGMFQNVTTMAADVGLTLDFNKAVVANSFDAHRLTHLAAKYGKKASAKQALFAAHFTDGKDIANHDVLLAIAIAIGLDKAETEAMLKGDLYAQEVKNEITEAAQLGINSVPFFVIDRKYGISGAQDSSTFLNALEKAFNE